MKRLLLWDYPRGAWQYDVIVVAILAFIFLIPRDVFRDQPRANSVVMLPSEQGANVFWIEPELLNAVAEPDRPSAALQMVRERSPRQRTLVRLERIFDAEGDNRGFLAYTKP